MTPDQLEKIGKAKYNKKQRRIEFKNEYLDITYEPFGWNSVCIGPTLDQFIVDAINEKLERITCPGVTPPTITLIDFAPSICTGRPHEIDEGSNTCKHCGTVYLHLPSNSKT